MELFQTKGRKEVHDSWNDKWNYRTNLSPKTQSAGNYVMEKEISDLSYPGAAKTIAGLKAEKVRFQWAP